MATCPRMRRLQLKNSGSMCLQLTQPDAKIHTMFHKPSSGTVGKHVVCCVQEKNLGLVERNRRAWWYPLGTGWLPSPELAHLLLLHLERSQDFRKGSNHKTELSLSVQNCSVCNSFLVLNT